MANFNKLRWKLMRMIVELIQKQGGIVFGGYNRDAIIHDYNARKYYEEYDNYHKLGATAQQIERVYFKSPQINYN